MDEGHVAKHETWSGRRRRREGYREGGWLVESRVVSKRDTTTQQSRLSPHAVALWDPTKASEPDAAPRNEASHRSPASSYISFHSSASLSTTRQCPSEASQAFHCIVSQYLVHKHCFYSINLFIRLFPPVQLPLTHEYLFSAPLESLPSSLPLSPTPRPSFINVKCKSREEIEP